MADNEQCDMLIPLQSLTPRRYNNLQRNKMKSQVFDKFFGQILGIGLPPLSLIKEIYFKQCWLEANYYYVAHIHHKRTAVELVM